MIPADDGQPDLPKSIQDVDRVDLGNVVQTATPKLFNKLLKDFMKESGVKVKQIGNNFILT